jgi:tRNA(Ile)-lysidine synthase
MVGPDPAVARLRSAVRPALADLERPVVVACSGGADSLALAAAVAFEAPRAGVLAGAVTIDHGLQPGSAERAAVTADLLRGLGLTPVEVLRVEVGGTGGPEAAARSARYAALAATAARRRAWIALGHTLDDQAETVLLGLGRGSGPRSLAGMVEWRDPWWRPLLGVRRETARAACRAQDLPVWDDPWNADPAYTRSRLRAEVLPLLEDVLGGGVAPALARTAAMIREDVDALDAIAAAELVELRAGDADGGLPDGGLPDGGLPVDRLPERPPAVRRRILRCWLLAAGVPDLQAVHLGAVDALVTRWHGQGPVDLPGGVAVVRTSGRLVLRTADEPADETGGGPPERPRPRPRSPLS